MKTDVSLVKAVDNHQIEVTLQDNRCGRFDMTPYLSLGAFQRLRNPGYFALVDVQFGAVTWPDGQDIAPDTLLSGMQWTSVNQPLPD